MSLFGRRKNRESDAVDGPLETEDTDTDDGAATGGPWDVEDVPDLGNRVDLGALRVPMRRGMKIRMEVDPPTRRRLIAVKVELGASSLQAQAFAAPRSGSIWDELREEISASIDENGGTVEEQEGPFGTELLARLPARTPDGRTGTRPARFIGIDGPRWFLRGVITGEAALHPERAGDIEEVLADIVVVRGHDPRAPRDLLTLHMPGKPGQEVPQADAARPTIDLGSPRGPEITEVR